MTWFLFALIAPLLFAITSHIDKILLEKYFKEGGVGTLMLFSSLLSIIAIPFIFFSDTSVIDVEPANIFILSLVGILNLATLWFYFLALQNDDASVVIVFYQLVPVIGLGLGYIVLGEILTQTELIAMTIIVIGTSIISFEIDDNNNFKLRRKTVFFMLAAASAYALESVIFKAVALDENVWRSLFWEHVMLVLIGIILFVYVPKYRHSFLSALKKNSKAILSLNVANEGIFMTGNIVLAFAIMLAPVALILLVESFRPFFVLAIGIILTIFFPKISSENISTANLLQKIFAILITGIGTYILLFHS